MRHTRYAAAVLAVVIGIMAASAPAADDKGERRGGEGEEARAAVPERRAEREGEALKRKLTELRMQERRLAEGGAGEEDQREVRQKREAVEREMRQLRERAGGERRPDREQAGREQAERGRAEHLRAAAEHLRAAGMHDLAEQVMRNAGRGAREGGDARPRGPGDGEGPGPALRREGRPEARGEGGVPRQIDELRREIARLREEVNELRRHVRERRQ
jgi:hypothetical protein